MSRTGPNRSTHVDPHSTEEGAAPGQRAVYAPTRRSRSPTLDPTPMSGLEALDAFLAAPQEDAVHFSASFTALTREERAALALRLQAKTSADNGAGNSAQDAAGTTAGDAGAMHSGSAQWENKAVTVAAVETALAGLEVAAAATEPKSEPRVQVVPDPLSDVEDVFLVDCEEEKGGNMNAVFSTQGRLRPTTFGNFVDEDADFSAAPSNSSDEQDERAEMANAEGAQLHRGDGLAAGAADASLEDLLQMADFGSAAVVPATDGSAPVDNKAPNLFDDDDIDGPVGDQHFIEQSAADNFVKKSSCGSNDDVDDDDGPDEEAVDLPGLDDEVENHSAKLSPSTIPHRMDREEMRQVMQLLHDITNESDPQHTSTEESDNGEDAVCAFELNPVVDYDSDLIGSAIRLHGFKARV